MKIATWNVNGIRARKSALYDWVVGTMPDILILQELKADEERIPDEILSLEGYSKFWNGSTFKKGYSGVGMLVRDDLNGNDGCYRYEIPDFDIENRTVVLHGRGFSLIGTYVPRGEGDAHYGVKLNYLEGVATYIGGLLDEGREIILTGDMNVAHTALDVHHSQNKPGAVGLRPEERSALDRQLQLGLHDIMRERHPGREGLYTWWPYWKGARERNLGWRIDCFYLSGGLLSHVQDVVVDIEEKSSDHAPVILDILALS